MMQALRGFIYRLPLIRGILARLAALEGQCAALQDQVAALQAAISDLRQMLLARREPNMSSEWECEVYGDRILWEIPVQLCIKDFLYQGDCAFDVGANIGGLSVAMSRKVGPSGQVHAFEPNPFILPRLKKNLEANGAANVIVIPKAVYSQSGLQLSFWCEDSYYQHASSLIKSWVSKPLAEVIVETISLDDYCQDQQVTPKVIKIDVEGAELQVLLGAERLLKLYSPVIVFEYQAQREEVHDPMEYLQSLGYVFYDVNLYQRVNREFYLEGFEHPPQVNVLAIPSNLFYHCKYQSMRVIFEREIEYAHAVLQSEPIGLICAGRYIVHIDFDASDRMMMAGLRVITEQGETLAYYEGPVSVLLQHSCQNMVFEIYSPCHIVCKFEPKVAKFDNNIGIKRIRISRVTFGA